MYFLPGYIALRRQVSNFMPIFLTNLFLGWTGIGWIVCLIWSVSDHVRPKTELSVDGQFISKILHGGIATLVENSPCA
jgi:TM2 domain-containing membrane protein YozV